jgi:hypothetical protein
VTDGAVLERATGAGRRTAPDGCGDGLRRNH